MASFLFEVSGEDAVQREVQKVVDQLGHDRVSRWMRTQVTQRMRERTLARFALQGDSASGKWKPLADPTIKRPILQDKLRLINYIRRASSAEAGGGDGDVTVVWPGALPHDKRVRWSYLASQFGTRTQPQRMIAISDQGDKDIIIDKFYRYIAKW